MSCGPLLLVLIGLPVLEITLLIRVGGALGGFETVMLVFLTASMGIYLSRGQSLSLLQKARAGQLPHDGEQLSGPLLAVGALLLLLPGFITDGLGAVLLIPPVRTMLGRYLVKRFGPGGPASQGGSGPGGVRRPNGRPPAAGKPTVIVVEATGPERRERDE